MKKLLLSAFTVIIAIGLTGCITGNNPNAVGAPMVKGPSFLNVGVGIPYTQVTIVNNNNEPVLVLLDNQYMNFKDGKPEPLQHNDTTSFKLVAVGGRQMEWAVMLQASSGTYIYNIRAQPNRLKSMTLVLKSGRLQIRQ